MERSEAGRGPNRGATGRLAREPTSNAGAAPPASQPTLRLVNVACRTVHLITFALLLGTSAAGGDPARVASLFAWTAGSGVALVALEVLAAGPRWFLEIRGLVVALKVGLLGLWPWAGQHRPALLVAAAVVASAGSHAPRWLRHATVWPRLRAGTNGNDDPDEPAHPRGAPLAGRE